MALDIFYNGNPLQTEEIIIERFEERSSPPKDILDLELAHKDGSRVVSITEKPKIIRMTGSLLSPTISGFLGLTDEFKKILSEQEKILKIIDGSETREWTASVIGEIKIPHEHWSTTYSPFEVSMYAADPYAKDSDFTTTSGTSLSGLFQDTVINFGGTKEPLPTIDYALTASGGLTGISLTNQVNNQTIDISRPTGEFGFKTSDIVSVDTAQLKTFLNGVEIPYSGMFPDFALGSNTLRSSFIASQSIQIDQSQEDNNTETVARDNLYVAQSFNPDISGDRHKMSILMKKSSAVTGNIILFITADSGGDPDFTQKSQEVAVSADNVQTSFTWIDFNFSTFPNLAAGTDFWMVISAPDEKVFNYDIAYQASTDPAVDPYTGGLLKTSTDYGATWSDPSPGGRAWDMAFRDYVSITAPTHSFNQTTSYKRRWR